VHPIAKLQNVSQWLANLCPKSLQSLTPIKRNGK